MQQKKQLGIWMDHSSAKLIAYSQDPVDTKVIVSDFTHNVKGEALGKGEYLMHNKEQHQQSEFYEKIGAIIRQYDNVILFGPTDAKAELFNTLSSDHHFDKIKIEMQHADKMTENQQHAFVREYFSKHH